jgi:hypothetical protein
MQSRAIFDGREDVRKYSSSRSLAWQGSSFTPSRAILELSMEVPIPGDETRDETELETRV